MKETKPYRPKGIKKSKRRHRIVVVPRHEDMDDETFLRHMELRHRQEVHLEGLDSKVSRHSVSAWIGSWRAFHGMLHKIEAPGQYDHEHEEE